MPVIVELRLDPDDHQPDTEAPDVRLPVQQRQTLRRALGIRTPLESAIELGKDVAKAAGDFARGLSTPTPER